MDVFTAHSNQAKIIEKFVSGNFFVNLVNLKISRLIEPKVTNIRFVIML